MGQLDGGGGGGDGGGGDGGGGGEWGGVLGPSHHTPLRRPPCWAGQSLDLPLNDGGGQGVLSVFGVWDTHTHTNAHAHTHARTHSHAHAHTRVCVCTQAEELIRVNWSVELSII